MKEGYNIVAGINVNLMTGGESFCFDTSGKNSFVVTSLDFLLDETERLLSMARELREKRDSEFNEDSEENITGK